MRGVYYSACSLCCKTIAQFHQKCLLMRDCLLFRRLLLPESTVFPLGWSKSYEFNESDLKVACDMLDTWIDATSLGRTNLPPDRVPWKAILTLLSQCIYGGKIDNEFDQRLLLSFLEKLFNAKCFEVTIRVFSSLVYALWT